MSQGWVVSPAVQLSAVPNPNISQPSLAFVNLIRIGATDLQERVYNILYIAIEESTSEEPKKSL